MQVLLTEEQDRRLEFLARRMHVSKAWLVREGVDLVLQRVEQEGADPLLSLVGQAGRVGRKDVSARHDAFLAVIERRRNR